MLQTRMVPMRDGIRLYTWCLTPDAPGQYPILFFRTPYDSTDMAPIENELALANAGYAVVHQCCRGTSRSEGVHVPFEREREDGLDTLDWIRQQPFYNGEIYVYGESYNAFVHYAYLDTCPEDIKGAMLWVMPTNMYRGATVNGIFKQDVLIPWYLMEYHKNQYDTLSLLKEYPEITKRRPLCKAVTSLYPDGCPELESVLQAGEREYPWAGSGSAGDGMNALRSLKVPILILEGWYDIYIGQARELWHEIPEEVRRRSAVLIGPWPHSCQVEESWDMDLPNGNAPKDLLLNWFDHLRTGKELNFVREGCIKYYTIGSGAWSCMADLPEVHEQVWYLNGDGSLSTQPGSSIWRSWRYDPQAPTQFRGGANGFGTVPSGIRADREPNSGGDLVSFVSAPLEKDMDITGSIEIELTVRSDCEDTAFFVRVSVLKNEKYLPVQESILTLRSQNPDYRPGDEAVVRMATDPTSWRFCKGDRLRVDVASANWPVYPAHGNVPGPMIASKETRVAKNEVKTGQSRVILPVVPAN